MPITKRHIATRELLGEYLTFHPTPKQVAAFEADMRSLHPTVLRDSIREGVIARGLKAVPAAQQRPLIHQIYTRKIKEFSAIYPFIFALENSLRSAMADYLAVTFGTMDWWMLIRDAPAAGKDHTHFPHIRTVTVSPGFVKAVVKVFDNLSVEQTQAVAGPDKTDEFYYVMSFGDLWTLIRADWTLNRPMFCSDAELGNKLDLTRFNNTMRTIKEARNGLYHSNPIKNRSTVVEACESMMNALNVNGTATPPTNFLNVR